MSEIPDKIGRLSLTLNDSISKVDHKGVLIRFSLTGGFRSGESTDCLFQPPTKLFHALLIYQSAISDCFVSGGAALTLVGAISTFGDDVT